MTMKRNEQSRRQPVLRGYLLAAFALAALLGLPQSAWAQWTTNGNDISNNNTGNVGINTTTPSDRLTIDSNSATHAGVRIFNSYSSSLFAGIEYMDNTGSTAKTFTGFQTSTGQFRINNIATNGYLDFLINSSSKLTVAHSGNVGIGTTSPQAKLDVQGDIIATGSITAYHQDVAEWVPSRHKLAAGTVVVLDPEQSNNVMASASAYDTRVAGVVSAAPGVILGKGGEGKVMVATTGRVKVKVDATRAPIRVGDLLVTSDIAGAAMKSEALNIGGVQFHRPGTLIGKALEPLAKGESEILVLLSLQ
jgi:hypothetical protein